MVSIEEQIAYITKDFGTFVKFTNTEDFPELSETTRSFLKNYGVYSYEKGYPPLVTDGILKKLDNDLIQIGKFHELNGKFYCINSETSQIVGYETSKNRIYIINSSIQKYIETLYTYKLFSWEIEGEEVLGEYWENHEKYAKKLQEMLETVEPNIMEYPTWGIQVEERFLGVI